MKILKVENLVKTYGSGDNIVRAVDGVSFEVERGEFVAIVLSAVLIFPRAGIFLLMTRK